MAVIGPTNWNGIQFEWKRGQTHLPMQNKSLQPLDFLVTWIENWFLVFIETKCHDNFHEESFGI